MSISKKLKKEHNYLKMQLKDFEEKLYHTHNLHEIVYYKEEIAKIENEIKFIQKAFEINGLQQVI